MQFKKLLGSDLKDTEDKVEKKNLTSIGSRLILIESSLRNVPSYMMSMFLMPKGFIRRCDFLELECFGKRKQMLRSIM